VIEALGASADGEGDPTSRKSSGSRLRLRRG
jgi:hypothetical protein